MPAASHRFARLVAVFGSALAVRAAVERHAAPREGDLRRLGIDPEQFRRVKR